jgi:hypothetical protein
MKCRPPPCTDTRVDSVRVRTDLSAEPPARTLAPVVPELRVIALPELRPAPALAFAAVPPLSLALVPEPDAFIPEPDAFIPEPDWPPELCACASCTRSWS